MEKRNEAGRGGSALLTRTVRQGPTEEVTCEPRPGEARERGRAGSLLLCPNLPQAQAPASRLRPPPPRSPPSGVSPCIQSTQGRQAKGLSPSWPLADRAGRELL